MKRQNPTIHAGTRVAILGAGVTGRAAARYGAEKGCELLISDIRPRERLLVEEADLLSMPRVQWEAGGHSLDFLRRADIILVSPGLDPSMGLLRQLQQEGRHLVGELALVAQECRVPVVAVTGTNGKTTVTTLLGDLLRAAGKKVFVGGNIGTPLYDYLRDPGDYELVVAEVSSFQLQLSGDFSPDIGILLNITPDHLDRHPTMADYVAAKQNLFANQRQDQVAIINGEQEVCRDLARSLGSTVLTFGTSDKHNVSYGQRQITLHQGGEKEIYDLAGTSLSGDIGLQNGAAAILAARVLGCQKPDILSGLQTFKALPHRLEYVATVAGVNYYNDSKATNTGAVISALAQFDPGVVLLAGGRDKGDDYRLLRRAVADKVQQVILIGEAAPQLAAALGDLTRVAYASSMHEAVRQASRIARDGDNVLLSPGCASFDMFTSYAHRGRVFIEAVLEMQKQATNR